MKALQFSKKLFTFSLYGMMLFFLAGCATWTIAYVEGEQDALQQGTVQPTQTNKILITEQDITDRPYTFLGDVTVTVNKTTIFHPAPTRELVNKRLREEGAKLGADAMILVRYGEGGITPMSWGSLQGKGRAVKFNK